MVRDLESIKKDIIPILKAAGVTRSFVFGSYARNEATDESDLDLIVEFDSEKSLLDVIHTKHQLEDVGGIEVDILSAHSIYPPLKKYIDRDKIQII